jgi:hypothetical protein
MDDILNKLDEDPITNGYPDYMYVGPSRGFIWSLSNIPSVSRFGIWSLNKNKNFAFEREIT